jgi:competence transcription factor ComK
LAIATVRIFAAFAKRRTTESLMTFSSIPKLMIPPLDMSVFPTLCNLTEINCYWVKYLYNLSTMLHFEPVTPIRNFATRLI